MDFTLVKTHNSFCSCCSDVLEFVLGFYLVHDHTMTLLKMLFHQVEELIAPVDGSFGIT